MLGIIIKIIWFIAIVYIGGTEALKMKPKIKWAFLALIFIIGTMFGMFGSTAVVAIMVIYNNINQRNNT